MKTLVSIRSAAFGNGTRKEGFEFGEIADLDKAIAIASEFNPDFEKLKWWYGCCHA